MSRSVKNVMTFGKRAMAIMLTALLTLSGLLSTGIYFGAQTAFADNVKLSVGSQIPYDNYSTGRYTADGEVAYCANPSKASPPAGNYKKSPVVPISNGWPVVMVYRVLYFGYGGPGFEDSVKAGWWPSKWYDGSAMTDDKYNALTHIIISDVFSADFTAATYGCSDGFKDYLSAHVLMVNWRNNTSHNSGTQYMMAMTNCPDDFADYCYQLNTGSSTQVILCRSFYTQKGNLDLQKLSGNETVTNGNSAYSLAGAVFELRDSSNKAVASATTDDEGKASFENIGQGTYTLVETVVPKGFDKADDATVTIESGKTVEYSVSEPPKGGNIKLTKKDSKRSNGKASGDGTLAGAVYNVINDGDERVYSAQYDKQVAPGGVVCKITTNEKGIASTVNEAANGWSIPDDMNGLALPLGKYKVVEAKSSEGYEVNDKWFGSAVIDDDTDLEEFETTEDAILGGLAVAKYDRDTAKSNPQGDAKMDGVRFRVVNSSDAPVVVNKTEYAVGKSVMTITGQWDEEYGRYVAKTDADALPYGTYTVTEVAAPKGYLLDDASQAWSDTVEIRKSGKVVNRTAADKSVSDRVKRGNIELEKDDAERASGDEQGDAKLSGAVYDIVNASAGPVYSPQYKKAIDPGSVVCQIVTGADGKASTVNAALNEWAIPDEWEGKALAYGKYVVRESKSSPGYNVNASWSAEVTVSEDAAEPLKVKTTEPVKRYGLAVAKYDRDTAASNPQGDATMAGTRFSVTNASRHPVMVGDKEYASGSVVCYIESAWDDEYGRHVAKTANTALPYGTYTVKEIAPPNGYLLDTVSQAWSDTIELHGDADGYVENRTMADKSVSNRVKRGNIALEKDDAQRASGKEQGDAGLGGAVYDIVNRSENAVLSPQYGREVQPGGVVCKIVTDGNGHASTTNASLNGWAIPEAWGGKALPFGTYEVVESKPSAGYNLNVSWKGVSVIRDDGQTSSLKTTEDVQRGMLKVGKVSRENGKYHEQGAASLEEWTFEIVNKSAQPVILGKGGSTEIAPGQVVTTISTKLVDGKYVASTAADALPYGTYEVHEIQTMRPQDNGYLFDDVSKAWSKTFTIRSEGQVVDFTGEEDAVPNQVVRGDLSFSKTAWPSMKALAGVPFKLTSVTTGEWHVVVTDRNGEVDTSAANYKHSYKTNSNDKAIKADGKVDETKLDYEAGVWFSGSTSMPVPANDARGALPFDTYTVEELRVEANAKFDLVTFEVTVTRDGKVIDKGTVDDTTSQNPEISTTLTDGQGGKVVAASAHATLVDAVTFNNLEKGEAYKLEAKLYTVSDGAIGEAVSQSTVQFEPRTSHGVKEVELELSTLGMEGKSLVCFEYLYNAKGEPLAKHEDPADEGQTVNVPQIGTTLTDDATGSHHAAFAEEDVVSLTDVVAYTGLTPKKTYTVKGSLRDKQTGEAVKDASGREVVAERTFVPTKSSGEVELPFTFRAAGLAGKAIVAFESLEYRGVEYAVHADIKDESQTVYMPNIGTSFADKETGAHSLSAMGEVSLVDTVSYENLEPGRTYSLEATLMDKASGAPVVDGKGNPLVSTVQFSPEANAGTVDVPFTVNASLLPQATVCFERLFAAEGVLAASHAAIDDEGQTIYKPAIATSLTEKATGFHSLTTAGKVNLIDTVAYTGLEPGREYTMHATLVDKETGKPLHDESGEAISSEVVFTPEELNGEVEVPFEVPADAIAPAAVCFERLYDARGTVAAIHEDVEDGEQTVYVPAIATSAADPRTGGQMAACSEKLRLVDTVAYEGLQPGAEYRLMGTVHVRNEDWSDAGALTDVEGNEVVAEATLVPESAKGLATITFKANVGDIAGKTLVVFEKLVYPETGAAVATHEDIADAGQTVYVPAIRTLATEKESGTHYSASTGRTQIVDKVSYENLVPGVEYTMSGELHAVGDEGVDAGPLKDAEGSIVAAERKFVPETPSGEVELSFEFDAATAPADVVVFERLMLPVTEGQDDEGNGIVREEVLAEHADISDAGQTVSVAHIATTARDARTGERVAALDGKLDLVDVVAYEGLQPGGKYKLSGAVHMRDAEGSDAGVLKDDAGKDVSATLEFTAEEASGSVEMAFQANAEVEPGTSLVVFESLADEFGREVARHADIADEGQTVSVVRIATNASDKGGQGSYIGSVAPFTIVDEVVYEGLVPNVGYMIAGTLHAVDENGNDLGALSDADGIPVTASKEFTPHEPAGSVMLEFDVDPSWMPARAVAFEQLGLVAEAEVVPVANHEDPRDENQTVRVAKISTTLTEEATGSHVLSSAGKTTLVDTVSYEGLQPGQPYRLEATLMDKATGKALHDADDGHLVAAVEFTPEKASGTVEVPLEVDASKLAGETVCFERLVKADGTVTAKHEDINDEAQTVLVPSIGTTATDPRTGTHMGALSERLAIDDVVAYERLKPGNEYKLVGVVHLRDAQGEDAGALEDAEGNVVKSETVFTPEEESGSITMAIRANADTRGKTAVVFEELIDERTGTVAARHADISDESQAVSHPEIATTATVQESGTHHAGSIAPFTVVDRVVYRGLQPGVKYVMTGALHAVTESGVDEGVVKDADGNELTSTKLFKPIEADGEVSIEFEVDPAWMPVRAVAFETCGLVVNGAFTPIAEHLDPNDEDQTVRMAKIATQARDKATGEKIGNGTASATVVDTVSYEGLKPGAEYSLTGTLMDKASGEPFKVASGEVTAVKTFVAQAPAGEVELEFNVQGGSLNGRDLVAFERLNDGEGQTVAVHEDINDKNQTVCYRAPGFDTFVKRAGDAFDKTGYWLAAYWWVIALVGALLLCAGAFRYMANDRESVFADEEGEAPARRGRS